MLFLPTTVSMPEDLEVFASHSYSASSSNTDLWTMRMCCRPWAIISYFFPFLISLPSLNQRTCETASERRSQRGWKTTQNVPFIQSLSRQTDRNCAHFDVLSGDFTFKPGRFLLFDLDIMERLRELNMWSCWHTERHVNGVIHLIRTSYKSLRSNERSPYCCESYDDFYISFKGVL